MKPSFALDFRDGVIALLHRTSRGWSQVGATTFDAPDLTEALAYLRSTALGLSPRGLATKLVIPNEQVLYTSVHAPGPDAAKRKRQIKAALEGLTPYAVDDLVYDWTGSGPEIQVAIIARETLAEAEAFAAEHRFNPVSFVAVPEGGGFAGEPFFGPSALAATLLAAGEKVERDADPISVVAREFARTEAVAAPEPVAEPAPVEDVVGSVEELAAPVEELAAPEPEPVVAVPEPAPAVAAPEPAPAVAPEPAAAPEPVSAADVPPVDPLPDFTAATLPPAQSPAFDPFAMAVDLVDEAPMALDVVDDRAELPYIAKTGTDPGGAAVQADDIPASPSAEIIAAFASRRSAALSAAAAMSAAAAKSAPLRDGGRAPVLGPAPAQPQSERGLVPRPGLARPVGPLPTGARDTLPFPPKTNVGKPVPGKSGKPNGAAVTAPGIAGARRERNVVPMLPTAATGLPDDLAQARAASKTTSRTTTGLDGRPMPSRGKPRFLGLILTGILLVLLALVAAWSSFFLTSTNSGPTLAPATETAAVTPADALPTPADEALADGQNPALAGSAPPDQAAADQAAADQAAADQAAADQAAADKLAADKVVADKVAADKVVADQAAADQVAADQVAADKVAADKAATDQAAADKATADNAAADKAAADKIAADQIAAQAVADKAAADKIAADQAAADKAAQDKAAADKAAADAAKPAPAPGTVVSTDAAVASAPGSDPQDEIFLAAPDTPPQTSDPAILAQVASSGDPVPDASPPPPPFGTVYQFDADGRIKPTPEGIITPEGVLLIAGKPKVVPPNRPAALTAALPVAAPVIAAATSAATAILPTAVSPDPSAAGPLAQTAATALLAPAVQLPVDPALVGKKPKARPASLRVQGQARAPVADIRLAGFRPQARPAALTQGPAVTVATAASESAAASLASNGVQASTSRLAVAVSPKPAARPSGLNQAVDAAVAAAIQLPDPQLVALPTADTSASVAPEAQAEPDVTAEAPAPRLPTNASVAKQATTKNALSLTRVALIGVFGSASQRYAMVRQSGGGIKKIVVGDTLDGGRVAAITANAVQYQKGGRMVTLSLPTL